jgi:hypothetical protein
MVCVSHPRGTQQKLLSVCVCVCVCGSLAGVQKVVSKGLKKSRFGVVASSQS